MKVAIFGATGMVGQGVLRECLHAQDVEEVRVIGRTPTGQSNAKVREIVRQDLFQYDGVDLSGLDACFFCLGVSANGLSEEQY